MNRDLHLLGRATLTISTSPVRSLGPPFLSSTPQRSSWRICYKMKVAEPSSRSVADEEVDVEGSDDKIDEE